MEEITSIGHGHISDIPSYFVIPLNMLATLLGSRSPQRNVIGPPLGVIGVIALVLIIDVADGNVPIAVFVIEIVVEDAVTLGVETGDDGGPRGEADGWEDGLDIFRVGSWMHNNIVGRVIFLHIMT